MKKTLCNVFLCISLLFFASCKQSTDVSKLTYEQVDQYEDKFSITRFDTGFQDQGHILQVYQDNLYSLHYENMQPVIYCQNIKTKKLNKVEIYSPETNYQIVNALQIRNDELIYFEVEKDVAQNALSHYHLVYQINDSRSVIAEGITNNHEYIPTFHSDDQGTVYVTLVSQIDDQDIQQIRSYVIHGEKSDLWLDAKGILFQDFYQTGSRKGVIFQQENKNQCIDMQLVSYQSIQSKQVELSNESGDIYEAIALDSIYMFSTSHRKNLGTSKNKVEVNKLFISDAQNHQTKLDFSLSFHGATIMDQWILTNNGTDHKMIYFDQAGFHEVKFPVQYFMFNQAIRVDQDTALLKSSEQIYLVDYQASDSKSNSLDFHPKQFVELSLDAMIKRQYANYEDEYGIEKTNQIYQLSNQLYSEQNAIWTDVLNGFEQDYGVYMGQKGFVDHAFFKQLLLATKYEVLETKTTDQGYTVVVEIYPVRLPTNFFDVYTSSLHQIGNVKNMKEARVDSLLNTLKYFLDKPFDYGNPVIENIDVITKNKEYQIDITQLNQLLTKMVDCNSMKH